MKHVVIVKVLGIEVRSREHIVVVGLGRISREDKVGTGHQLEQRSRGAAGRRVGKTLVVTRGAFQTEQGGRQVLTQHLTNTRRNGCGNSDTADRAVLRSLRSRALGHVQAAAFEIQHGFLFAVSHEHLRAGARGKSHLQSARSISGIQKCFGIGRVVTVDEHLFGTVDRNCLSVCSQAADTEVKLGCFLGRALGQHAGTSDLRANENGHGRERRVTRNSHGRFLLGKAAQGALSRVGRELDGLVLEIGDMRLIGWLETRAHFLHAHHHLDHVEISDDLGHFGGRDA